MIVETGRDVRLVFTASKTLFGRLIRWLTSSPVSHVFLEYDSTLWGGRWVAEATIGGVRKVPSYKARHNVVCEYKLTANPELGCKAIAKFFGNAYDYVGIFWMAWFVIAWRWLRLKFKKPLRSSKSQLCSELMARFVEPYIQQAKGWDPEEITPEGLRRYCEMSTGLFWRVRNARPDEDITPREGPMQ